MNSTLMFPWLKTNSLFTAVTIGLFKALCTSALGRHIHHNINSTSLGKIQPHCAASFTHVANAFCKQEFIYTSERTGQTWRERNCPGFETKARVFEPDHSRLRAKLYISHTRCQTMQVNTIVTWRCLFRCWVS